MVIELSTTGCVLSRTPPLAVGTEALLLLRPQALPDPLVLRCRIVRPVPRGHAVELAGLTDVQRLKLAEALDELGGPEPVPRFRTFSVGAAAPPSDDEEIVIPLSTRADAIPLVRRPALSIPPRKPLGPVRPHPADPKVLGRIPLRIVEAGSRR
jgi:hypothetical protein